MDSEEVGGRTEEGINNKNRNDIVKSINNDRVLPEVLQDVALFYPKAYPQNS